MISKERIKHDWEYCLQRHALGDEEERYNVCRTAKAIYERAVREYGYRWAEDNLPKPGAGTRTSRSADDVVR